MKCPKCGSKIEFYGSDCYPEIGYDTECENDECDFEFDLKINYPYPKGKIYGVLL